MFVLLFNISDEQILILYCNNYIVMLYISFRHQSSVALVNDSNFIKCISNLNKHNLISTIFYINNEGIIFASVLSKVLGT